MAAHCRRRPPQVTRRNHFDKLPCWRKAPMLNAQGGEHAQHTAGGVLWRSWGNCEAMLLEKGADVNARGRISRQRTAGGILWRSRGNRDQLRAGERRQMSMLSGRRSSRIRRRRPTEGQTRGNCEKTACCWRKVQMSISTGRDVRPRTARRRPLEVMRQS